MGEKYYAGSLLVAMPHMTDPRFFKAVILLCVHDAQGAMGLILNRPIEDMTFSQLLEQVQVEGTLFDPHKMIHYGGPVEGGRGFILHTPDYTSESSIPIKDVAALTGTLDALTQIAQGKGPRQSLFALGYSGWGPGQLETEIASNGWLVMPPDQDLIFSTPPALMWEKALKKLGIHAGFLSPLSGNA